MKSAVIVPNLNGQKDLASCLDSLIKTGFKHQDIFVIDNGSSDGSVDLLESKYPKAKLIKNPANLGFAAAVNQGIKAALKLNYEYIALFNNDALAAADWLKKLEQTMEQDSKIGIVTGKMLTRGGSQIDSTGEFYTTWGLPYPRGRGEPASKFDQAGFVFGASGGASLYKSSLFKDVGLFDEDFFAYYEDVDLSFRAQLAGWKVFYEPGAIVYHGIGQTSSKIPGFTTYQTLKNLPLLYWKNVPGILHYKILPRFCLAYLAIYFSALARGQFGPATRGLLMALDLLPKKLWQRWQIQSKRRVSAAYIAKQLIFDLPPDANRLRNLRQAISLGFIK